MTRELCIQIAARALSIFLFVWAVSDVISLPHLIVSIRHYQGELSMGNGAGRYPITLHYLRLEVTYLCETLLRIALWLIGAKWLYSCGPWLQAYLAEAKSATEPVAD